MTRPAPFQAYVAAARNGRHTLWRTILGTLIVLVIWGIVSTLVVTGGLVLEIARGTGAARIDEAFADLFASPLGIACLLASFCGIWIGVWAAVRLLHGRRLSTVLGAEGRLNWGDFLKGAGAVLVASVVMEPAMIPFDATFQRNAIDLGTWAVLLAPMIVLLLVQISAEELMFRGYLPQLLAARFQSPFVWALIPVLLFTVAHWDPAALPWMNASILVVIAGIAATTTALVYFTGNLGAAMGLHFGANFFSVFVFSRVEWANGIALFSGKPVNAPDWSVLEAIILAVVGLATMAVILWLLLSLRSPLKVSAIARSADKATA